MKLTSPSKKFNVILDYLIKNVFLQIVVTSISGSLKTDEASAYSLSGVSTKMVQKFRWNSVTLSLPKGVRNEI